MAASDRTTRQEEMRKQAEARMQEFRDRLLDVRSRDLVARFDASPERLGMALAAAAGRGELNGADLRGLFDRIARDRGREFAGRAFGLPSLDTEALEAAVAAITGDEAVEGGLRTRALAESIVQTWSRSGASPETGDMASLARSLASTLAGREEAETDRRRTARRLADDIASGDGLRSAREDGPDAAALATADELEADLHFLEARRHQDRARRIIDDNLGRAAETERLLQRLGPAVGVSPSEVEVRVDDEAARRTGAARAQGIEEDRVVYLDPGTYDPGTREGRELLGHEVAHAAQEGLSTDLPSRPLAELEAAAVGEAFATGDTVPMPTQAMPAMDLAANIGVNLVQQQLEQLLGKRPIGGLKQAMEAVKDRGKGGDKKEEDKTKKAVPGVKDEEKKDPEKDKEKAKFEAQQLAAGAGKLLEGGEDQIKQAMAGGFGPQVLQQITREKAQEKREEAGQKTADGKTETQADAGKTESRTDAAKTETKASDTKTETQAGAKTETQAADGKTETQVDDKKTGEKADGKDGKSADGKTETKADDRQDGKETGKEAGKEGEGKEGEGKDQETKDKEGKEGKEGEEADKDGKKKAKKPGEEDAQEVGPDGKPLTKTVAADGEKKEGQAGKEGEEGGKEGGPAQMPDQIHLAPLPELKPEQVQKYVDKTGVTPEDHERQIQAALDDLLGAAQQAKDDIAIHTAELSVQMTEAQTGREQQVDQVQAALESQIQAAAQGARSKVTAASKQAQGAVNGAAAAALNRISGSEKSQTAAADTAYTQMVSAFVTKGINGEATLYKTLEDEAKKFSDAGKAKGDEAKKKIDDKANAIQAGVSARERVRSDAMVKVLKSAAEPSQKRFVTQGEQAAKQVLTQKQQASTLVKNFLGKLSTAVQQQLEAAKKKITDAASKGRTSVESTKKSAIGNITSTAATTLSKLTKSEKETTAGLKQSGSQLKTGMASQQGEVRRGVAEASEKVSQRFDGQMADLDGELSKKSGLPDMNALQGKVTASKAKLLTDRQDEMGKLDAMVNNSNGQIDMIMGMQLEQMNGMASSKQGEMEQLALQGEQSLQQLGGNLSKSISNQAQGVVTQITGFAKQVTDAATKSQTDADTGITQIDTGFKDALGTKRTEVETAMTGQIAKAERELDTQGKAAGDAAIQKLKKKAVAVRNACDGWGTDESGIMNALSGLTRPEAAALQEEYQDHYGKSLRADLESELSGDDLAEALAHLSGNRVQGALQALNNSISMWGDDEKKIEDTLRNLSKEEIEELKKDPKAAAIIAKCRDNLGSQDLDVFNALLDGDKVKADAIRLQEAMDGWGTNEQKVYDILERQGSDEDRAALQAKFAEYVKQKEGRDVTLKGYIGEEFSGAEKDLADCLVDNDKIGAAAAKLEIAADGAGTDEKKIFDTLEDPDMNSKDPEKRAAAMARREELKKRYESKYGRSVDQMIQDEMGDANQSDNYEAQVARDMLNKGEVDPALAIKYSVDGAGTDEEFLKKALKGKTPDEIAKIKSEYQKRYGVDLEEELGVNGKGGFFTEVSGKEGFEVECLLMGKPQTPEQWMALARKQHEFQRGGDTSGMDFMEDIGATETGSQMDKQMARMESYYAEVGDWSKATPEQKARLAELGGFMQDDTESYQAAKDKITDAVVTGIEVIGAVVTTIVTAGAASPVLAAVLCAAATGAATMAAKAAIQGGSYGWEEAGSDLAKTGVSMATGGLGQMKSLGNLAGNLASKIPVNNPVFQAAMKEGIKGGITGSLGGLGNAMLNEQAWDKGSEEWLKGLVIGTATGGAGGFVGGAFQGGMDEHLGPAKSALGRATREGIYNVVQDTATAGFDPNLYQKDFDDAFWSLAKSVPKSFVQGAAGGFGAHMTEKQHTNKLGEHLDADAPKKAPGQGEDTSPTKVPGEDATHTTKPVGDDAGTVHAPKPAGDDTAHTTKPVGEDATTTPKQATEDATTAPAKKPGEDGAPVLHGDSEAPTKTDPTQVGGGNVVSADAGTNGHRVAANSDRVEQAAKAKLKKMTPDEQAAFEGIKKGAENDAQKVILDRALAAGSSMDDVRFLADAMRGMKPEEVMKTFTGEGVFQAFRESCVPTSYQIARAEVDPVYAWKLKNDPIFAMQEQKTALDQSGGRAIRRPENEDTAFKHEMDSDPAYRAHQGDDANFNPKGTAGIEPSLMKGTDVGQGLEGATGRKYQVLTDKDANWQHGKGDGQFQGGKVPLHKVNAALDAGLPVPFSMMGHESVIIGKFSKDGEVHYVIHDPWTGRTSTMQASHFNMGGMLTPTTFSVPKLTLREKATASYVKGVLGEMAAKAMGVFKGDGKGGGKGGKTAGAGEEETQTGGRRKRAGSEEEETSTVKKPAGEEETSSQPKVHEETARKKPRIDEEIPVKKPAGEEGPVKTPRPAGGGEDALPQVPHTGVEMHNHFNGVLNVEYFVSKFGGGEEGPARTFERIKRFMTDNPELQKEAPTVWKNIEEMSAKKNPTRDDYNRVLNELLTATETTPFDHAYTPRGELVKEMGLVEYVKQNPGRSEEDIRTTINEGKRLEAEIKSKKGKKEFDRKPKEEQEAIRKQIKDASALANKIEAIGYQGFVEDTLRALARDGVKYSEQSFSVKKALRAVPPEMVLAAVQKVRAEFPNLKDFDMKFLPLVTTSHLSDEFMLKRDEKTGHVTGMSDAMGLKPGQQDVVLAHFKEKFGAPSKKATIRRMSEMDPKMLEAELTKLFASNPKLKGGEKPPSAEDIKRIAGNIAGGLPADVRQGLIDVIKHGDVIGFDVAAPEKSVFTQRGIRNFEDMYKILFDVANPPEGSGQKPKRPVVLRPHVGEGYTENDTPETSKTGFSAHKDVKRGKDGEYQHYTTAQKNLELMIKSLEAKGYTQGKDGIIIRFGHATHATPDQAARMARMGIIAEVNLGSNDLTGAVQHMRDHAFLNLMYHETPVMLSTDAQSVMHTTMQQEFDTAAGILRDFRNGKIKLEIDGKETAFNELSEDKQKRFTIERLQKASDDYEKLVGRTK